jgi:hypothetical protein
MIKIISTEGIAIMFRQLRRTTVVACLCSLGMLAWSATAPAATIIGNPVLLSTLTVPNGNIVVGDKTFTNFTYNFTGDMPPASVVNVIPITDDFGNFGIRFQGAFIDTTGIAGGSDALITYRVTAAQGFLISDAHLQGNPALLGTQGSISVTETFLPLSQVPPYQMTIYADQNLGTKMTDETAFTPIQSLNVQKDILALAKLPNSSGTPQTVTMSFVDQTFSQVPEASAVLLSLIGCVGFGLKRQRHESSFASAV